MDIPLETDFILEEIDVKSVIFSDKSYDLTYRNVLEDICRAV